MIASPPPMPRWSRASQRDITSLESRRPSRAWPVWCSATSTTRSWRRVCPPAPSHLLQGDYHRQRRLPGQAKPDHVPDRPSDLLADRGRKGARGASRARRAAAAGVIFPFLASGAVLAPCLSRWCRPSVACGRSHHRDSRGRRREPGIRTATRSDARSQQSGCPAVDERRVGDPVWRGGLRRLSQGLVVIGSACAGPTCCFCPPLADQPQARTWTLDRVSGAELAPALTGCAALVAIDLACVRLSYGSRPS